MNNATASAEDLRLERNRFLAGLLRGAGGALIFGLPMLMTMELWSLGFTIEPLRLLLSVTLTVPLLFILAQRMGFERTFTWHEAIRDATVAFAIGIVVSLVLLVMLGVLKTGMPPDEWVGKVAIQSIPASIGALLGRSQLGGQKEDDEEAGDEADEDPDEEDEADRIGSSYPRELFMMAIGALFLSLNVAPTEEVALISYKMTHWHTLVAIFASITLMHGFVYALAFRGGHELSEDTPRWHAFVRFTVPGYVIAVAISLYVLWVFGRLDDTAWTQILMTTIVLAFPASIGAAAARLIL
ncbi:TIGR02587 family membrane protein [Neorhizobium sp. NPDC001467]|uniref:TIGR02587 family membrane protein n=1 Tax=Neorhizobium sp. NPDC001467 TaxID=3390595 RepID=UPI003D011135